MVQTTLAVQTVERVRGEQVDLPVCGVHMHSACIEFSSLGALVAYRGCLAGKFLENGYHKIESRSYF